MSFTLPMCGTIQKNNEIDKSQTFISNSPNKKSAYAGVNTCRKCHEKQYNKWIKTKHSKAMIDLILSGDDKNIRCLRCHTTGLSPNANYPSKFSYLENVQCEACHGPGNLHVLSAKKNNSNLIPSKNIRSFSKKCPSCITKICMECHDISCSKFSFDDFLKQIAH